LILHDQVFNRVNEARGICRLDHTGNVLRNAAIVEAVQAVNSSFAIRHRQGNTTPECAHVFEIHLITQIDNDQQARLAPQHNSGIDDTKSKGILVRSFT